jgi:hypothetical protein
MLSTLFLFMTTCSRMADVSSYVDELPTASFGIYPGMLLGVHLFWRGASLQWLIEDLFMFHTLLLKFSLARPNEEREGAVDSPLL